MPVPSDTTISGLDSAGFTRRPSQRAILTGLLCPLIPPSWTRPTALTYAGLKKLLELVQVHSVSVVQGLTQVQPKLLLHYAVS